MFAVGISSNLKRILHLNNELTGQEILFESEEIKEIKISIKNLPLQSGNFKYTLFSRYNGQITDWVVDAGQFNVEDGDFFKTGRIVPKGQGDILVKHNFILGK